MTNINQIKCKASFAYGEKDVRVEDRVLEYSPDDVLVRVACGGICGSDIHYYQHGRAGMSILKHPMVVGHEFVGVVESAPQHSGLNKGQHVAINPSKPCNHCEFCLSGKQNQCQTMRFMGSAQFNPHVNGGFSEYVVVTPEQCIPYKATVSAKVMAFSEPLAVAIHAINVAGNLVGKKVLVTGAGPIGCLLVAAAKSAGAKEVVASDVSTRCRELAIEMGASATFDPVSNEQAAVYQANKGYFDVVFEASGASSAIMSTVGFTRPTGQIVQVGMGSSQEFPLSAMLVKEITLKGSFRFIDEFVTSVKWLEDGRINPLPLVTSEFKLHDIETALITAADKTKSAKVLVSII